MPERRRRDLLTPLLLSLALILLLAFWVFKPFILVFAVAACVALLLAPAQKRLDEALGGRPTLASAILVLLTTVVILVPVLTSLFLLARQTALFLDWVRLQPLLGPEEMQRFWDELPRRYPGLKSWIAFLQAQIAPILAGGISQLAGGANGLLQNVLGRVTHAAIDLGLFLLMLFFLLRDGGPAQGRAAPDLALLRRAGATRSSTTSIGPSRAPPGLLARVPRSLWPRAFTSCGARPYAADARQSERRSGRNLT